MATAALETPLISGATPEDELEHDETGNSLSPNGEGNKSQDGQLGVFVLLLTVAAGISGLLFGYDTGVISATLVSIDKGLSNRTLTSLDKSVITSSTALFALLISPFSSLLADSMGRKRVVLLADVLFMLGAILQALSSTVVGMIVGRCIIGAGVGAASFVVPLYIAEIAPAAHRGRLVTINILFITLGQVVAYIVGWLFTVYGTKETGWRWMVGLGAAPAAAQSILVAFMPETPRWLVKVGRSSAARTVLRRISGNGAQAMRQVDSVIKEIEIEVREEQDARRLRGSRPGASLRWLGGWHELLTVGRNRRALTIACLLQGLQQLCGFNVLMYFSATIFTQVGFRVPTLTSLSVAATNFAFTVIALFLIDRIGRRRILLYSLPFMVLGLLISAFGFSFVTLRPQDGAMSPASVGPGPVALSERWAAGLILVSIMLYVSAYAIGLGNVPWMQSELFPLSVRSLGSGVATATNWLSNFIIGLTFLPLTEAISPSWTFVLYAGICGVGNILVWGIYPETAGLSLEEATSLLDNGWGVQ